MGTIWQMLMQLCRRFLASFFKLLRKDLTDKQWKTCEQFIKFALVGCSNSLVCLVICYVTLFAFGSEHYLFCQTLGYIVAVLNSFFWNSKYVFSDYRSSRKAAFGKMCLCNMAVYGLQMGILYLLVDILIISEWIAPVLAILASLPVNFGLNKFFAFRRE